jgi:hypothetical protein
MNIQSICNKIKLTEERYRVFWSSYIYLIALINMRISRTDGMVQFVTSVSMFLFLHLSTIRKCIKSRHGT